MDNSESQSKLESAVSEMKKFEDMVNELFKPLKEKYPTSIFWFVPQNHDGYKKDNPNEMQVAASFNLDDLHSL